MKKSFLLLLMLMLCSTAAWAATEYGLYVAGTKVTSDNCDNIVNDYITGGTVVYTPSSKTLTLTNVTINTGTTDNNCINNYNCEGLTIRFEGTCKLTANNYDHFPINVEDKTYLTVASGTTTLTQNATDGDCIHTYTKSTGHLFIYGPGKLELNSPRGYGIVCESSSTNLRVTYQNSCDVTITSAKNCIRRGSHYFSDGTVTLKATNNSEYPNVNVASMFFNGGAAITAPDGAYFDYSSGSQYNKVKVDGNPVYIQDVIITNNYALLLNSTNFPDANFRAYMRSLYSKGYMTQDEVNARASLVVGSKSISDMKGVEKLTALTQLICYDNPLTSLDVSALSNLTYLDVGHTGSYTGTKLTTLNVSSCSKLQTLFCQNNNITSLDLSSCSSLKQFYCRNTKLTSLTVTDKTKLTTLDCSDCTSLTTASIKDNSKLAWLDFTGCTALEFLYCDNNFLTELDVTSNTQLRRLSCDNNRLTSLDVSPLSRLEYLNCDNNRLTSLDVQGCSSLKTVNCYQNKFTDAGMTTLVNSLPTRSSSSKGTLRALYNTGENNVFTSAHAAAAAAKNWDPYRYNGSSWVLITAIQPGDVDGDGHVTVADVTALIDLLLDGGTPPAAADVDGDGQVTVADVTALIDGLLSN